MKFIGLFALSSCLIGLTTGCGGSALGSGETGTVVKSAINGRSSVTFSGAVNRTARYGTDPNTGAYCASYSGGTTSITLRENGENRNNSGWMKDGLSFSFYNSARPQDVTVIDGAKTSAFAVVKELEKDGTFNLRSRCSFQATMGSENKMYVRFSCPDLTHANGSVLSVSGWIECVLVEQNY